jgi:hypothetical protein
VRASTPLIYLGALRGEGTLVSLDDDDAFGRAEFDFAGFLNQTKAVVASGELRMDPVSLERAFGRRDLVLHTDTGMHLPVRFSGRLLAGGTPAAHVDITEGLPPRADWPSRADI